MLWSLNLTWIFWQSGFSILWWGLHRNFFDCKRIRHYTGVSGATEVVACTHKLPQWRVWEFKVSLGNNQNVLQGKHRAKLSYLGRVVLRVLHFQFSGCPWLVGKQRSTVSRSAKWHLSCNKNILFVNTAM